MRLPGELIRTLEHTGPAEEFLLSDGILVVLVNPNTAADVRRGVGPGACVWWRSTPTPGNCSGSMPPP